MIEVHHYPPFIPAACTRLFVGSFPGKLPVDGLSEDDWYYGTGKTRNQFWPIMRQVFGHELKNKTEKMEWCQSVGFGFADIIYSCERRGNSNLDSNLINRTYDIELFQNIFNLPGISQLLFTGKGVMHDFIKKFKYPTHIRLTALPSPSPAYAAMNFQQKVIEYTKILQTM